MPIYNHQFENGLVLLAESMPWLESAAFAFLMPAGCSREPAELSGLGSLTCEMAQRGSGTRDSRQFIEDLEMLGVESSAAVSNGHTSFGGAMPAESLLETLDIYVDLVRRPHFPEDELEESRLGCLQEVRALEDDLAQKVLLELRRRQYADPFGRSSLGTIESLERVTLPNVRTFFDNFYRPNGTILCVAGKINWPQLLDRVGAVLSDWKPADFAPLAETPPVRGYEHLAHESTQTHISLSYENVPYSHPDYYEARAAVGVLSDGMSSRLFTEVREKRGLCYTVYASCNSLRDRGCVTCYAGTTTERAQETYDVTVTELKRLATGVSNDELQRLKSKLKSALIMQQESSTSRAASIASDWYHLGRILTMDELGSIIDNLCVKKINAYLAAHPPRGYTIVTLGEKPLKIAPEDLASNV